MVWLIAICISLSLVSSLVLVPVVRSFARRIGAIDRPDKERKLQADAVALGGGVAVFLSLVIAFVGTILIDRAFFGYQLGYNRSRWYLLFGSAAVILIVGLIDDIWSLRGRQKLLAQILIVAMLVGSGTVIEQIGLFGAKVDLGVFAFPVTMLWLLVAINALNLIDGADGMATTVGIVICLGLGAASIIVGGGFATIVGFGLAGALLGFLVFNKPPATIYLGDAGSMMIGLFLGVLAIWTKIKEPSVLATAPIAIFALPLFDSTAAIMRRWLTGRSIYQTDRGHLHHLIEQKFGRKWMLLIVGVLSLITTTISLFSIRASLPFLPILGVLVVVGLLVATKTFGHTEMRLLFLRMHHFAHSFSMVSNKAELKKYHRKVPMQGDGAWETIWEPLVDFAIAHHLARVKVDLSLPWIHEGFHASWQNARMPEKASQLSICLPLFTKARIDPEKVQDESVDASDVTSAADASPRQVLIGRLEVVASASDNKIYDRLNDLVDHLAEMGGQVDAIVSSLEAAAVAAKLSQQRTGRKPRWSSSESETLAEPAAVADSIAGNVSS